MKLRFSLGKKKDITNVITNGNFASGSTGWQFTNFSVISGRAVMPANGVEGRIKSTTNPFELGEEYELSFSFDKSDTSDSLYCAAVGDWGRDNDDRSAVPGT